MDLKLVISKLPPSEIRIEVPIIVNTDNLKGFIYKRQNNGELKLIKEITEIAYKKVLEMAVKFSDLGIKHGEEFRLAFFIEENGITLERQPETGPVRLICPTSDYEAYNWTA